MQDLPYLGPVTRLPGVLQWARLGVPMTLPTTALLLAILASLACGAAPAAAEWNFDLYGGATWIPSSDVKVRGEDDTGTSVRLTLFDIEADTGLTVGTRVGYWLESVPFLGFDLDVFYMQVSVPDQTRKGTASFTGQFLDRPISVSLNGTASIPSGTAPLVGFAPEIRLRWPLLRDATFSKGRLQPYISAGPAFAFSLKNEDPVVEVGGKVGIGVAFQLTRWLAIFAEYRFIFYPGFEVVDRDLTYQADIKTHSMVGGLSFRF